MQFDHIKSSLKRSSSYLPTPGPSSPSKTRTFYKHCFRERRRPLYIILCVVLGIFYYVFIRKNGHARLRARAPETVIVVMVDRKNISPEYAKKIVDNRKRYCQRWGYGLFVKDSEDYQWKEHAGAPASYAKLPILRHAMSTYPYTQNFFYLSSNALIMNPSLSINSHILKRKRLSKIMLRGQDIIPPSGVIKTYKNTDPRDIQLILTQDSTGISTGSMILRRTEEEMPGGKKNGGQEYGYFLLDVWWDPLYKSYKFKKEERHALEHIVQWHATILSKLAIIPQRVMNAYPVAGDGVKPVAGNHIPAGLEGSGYQTGDFVVHLEGCEEPERNCANEFAKYWKLSLAAEA